MDLCKDRHVLLETTDKPASARRGRRPISTGQRSGMPTKLVYCHQLGRAFGYHRRLPQVAGHRMSYAEVERQQPLLPPRQGIAIGDRVVAAPGINQEQAGLAERLTRLAGSFDMDPGRATFCDD